MSEHTPAEQDYLTDKMRIAVVGGGRRCFSLLKTLESGAFKGLKAEIVGVADINPEAVGYRYAGEKGVPTYEDYREMLDIPGLELVINLTGSEDLNLDLADIAPESVAVLHYQASRLFQEIVKEVLNAGRQMDRQEDVISRAESFSRAMARATIVGVMVLDTHYRINWINDAALQMSGLTMDEALGRYCFQVSHQLMSPCAPPQTSCPMLETLATGQAAHAIHEHYISEGQTRYCDVTTFPLHNKEGKVVEVVEVMRDMTADLNDKLERRTQALKDDLARMVQEDKLIALGKMVASVAHEINNPIASIINFAKLVRTELKEGTPTPERMVSFDRYLDLTVREAQRCGKIVTSLLSFARQQPIEPKIIDLIDILERILILTRHKLELSNIELSNEVDGDGLELWGDYTQIQQCLINLIFNAMEAMPEGGRLTIRGGVEPDRHRIWLEIIDTGMGISKENLPNIFEPFFTTKQEGQGVGLGLSMVYGIVSEHGGEISVKSEEGQGTCFTIRLPSEPSAYFRESHHESV